MVEPSSEPRRALYLRWRPLDFEDVVGQEHVVRTLRNAVRSGTPAHAYLFAGPRGTGKTSLARILFRAVNCLSPRDGSPCGTCQACCLALEGRTMDLVEIDAASNRGIDDIRELREKVAFAPSDVRYRVYIVDEAHELTAAAWDAFLKTLEEPPPHAIFVLATTEAHRVPATIVSRCQRFDFRRIRPAAIRERLAVIAEREGIAADAAALDRLARMARGGLRDAISLLEQAAAFSTGRVDLEALREALGLADPRFVRRLVEAIARRDASAALELLVAASEEGYDLRLLAEDMAAFLRAILFTSEGAARALAAELSADDLAWAEQLAGRWEGGSVRQLLREIVEALARIRDGVQFQLAFELAVLGAAAGPAETLPSAGAAASGTEPRPPAPRRLAAFPEAETELAAPSSAERQAESTRFQVVEAREVVEETSPPATLAAAEQSSAAGDSASAMPELELVRERWPRVVEWVRHRNSFVASYLQSAELAELREDVLALRFAFKVHYERVSDNRNRTLIEAACQQVLGRGLRLRCEYTPPTRSREALDLDDPVLKFALEKFGGQAEPIEL